MLVIDVMAICWSYGHREIIELIWIDWRDWRDNLVNPMTNKALSRAFEKLVTINKLNRVDCRIQRNLTVV